MGFELDMDCLNISIMEIEALNMAINANPTLIIENEIGLSLAHNVRSGGCSIPYSVKS